MTKRPTLKWALRLFCFSNYWAAIASGKYFWFTSINEFMMRLPLSDTWYLCEWGTFRMRSCTRSFLSFAGTYFLDFFLNAFYRNDVHKNFISSLWVVLFGTTEKALHISTVEMCRPSLLLPESPQDISKRSVLWRSLGSSGIPKAGTGNLYISAHELLCRLLCPAHNCHNLSAGHSGNLKSKALH